ncbi:uncharacterized protein LOC141706742 [Apium graveolens]|uniref:uncharacterized protein LOC141706742 n=1 Tax=Apium graveolens TaxID=4045 RepID=UPI003D7905B8
MSWKWHEEHLDRVLVPAGILIMFIYHVFFCYRYLKFPLTTAQGSENYYKKIWVEKMMQLEAKDKGTTVAVINSNISAASSLSSVSLVLSSLIGALIGSSNEKDIFTSRFIYGDSSPTVVSIKYIALLCCFLVGFAAFIQTTRNYALAAFLISIPNCDIPADYVQKPFIRASHFYMAGMRALQIATTLIMWIFGPIPMFVSSIVLVAILYILDRNLTPLYQFQQQLHNTKFRKIGEELASVTRGLRHQEGANVN